MTVRYSSASASAAGSTGCLPYSCQAPTMVLNPRLQAEDDFTDGEARSRAGCLRGVSIAVRKTARGRLTRTICNPGHTLSGQCNGRSQFERNHAEQGSGSGSTVFHMVTVKRRASSRVRIRKVRPEGHGPCQDHTQCQRSISGSRLKKPGPISGSAAESRPGRMQEDVHLRRGICASLYVRSKHSGAQAAKFQARMTSTAATVPAYVMTKPTTIGDRIRHERSIRRIAAPCHHLVSTVRKPLSAGRLKLSLGSSAVGVDCNCHSWNSDVLAPTASQHFSQQTGTPRGLFQTVADLMIAARGKSRLTGRPTKTCLSSSAPAALSRPRTWPLPTPALRPGWSPGTRRCSTRHS